MTTSPTEPIESRSDSRHLRVAASPSEVFAETA
jgi:hypothetical protein